jgi:hypothetical protein
MTCRRHRQKLARLTAGTAEWILRRVPSGRRVGIRRCRVNGAERVVGAAERVSDRPLRWPHRQRVARHDGRRGRREHTLSGEL